MVCILVVFSLWLHGTTFGVKRFCLLVKKTILHPGTYKGGPEAPDLPAFTALKGQDVEDPCPDPWTDTNPKHAECCV